MNELSKYVRKYVINMSEIITSRNKTASRIVFHVLFYVSALKIIIIP